VTQHRESNRPDSGITVEVAPPQTAKPPLFQVVLLN